MRRFLTVPAAILMVLVLIAGCTSSDVTADETTTAAPATTVAPPETATTAAASSSTPPKGEAAMEPHQVVERFLQAVNEGDAATALSYSATDAVVIHFDGDSEELFAEIDGDGWGGDFDGDGAVTGADGFQHMVAMVPSMMESRTWECVTTAQDYAECTETIESGFTLYEPNPIWIDRFGYRVEAGQIVENRALSDPDDNATANRRWWRTAHAYERWVEQNYPDRWADLFHEPCCNLNFKWLPHTVPIHADLVAEYLANP